MFLTLAQTKRCLLLCVVYCRRNWQWEHIVTMFIGVMSSVHSVLRVTVDCTSRTVSLQRGNRTPTFLVVIQCSNVVNTGLTWRLSCNTVSILLRPFTHNSLIGLQCFWFWLLAVQFFSLQHDLIWIRFLAARTSLCIATSFDSETRVRFPPTPTSFALQLDLIQRHGFDSRLHQRVFRCNLVYILFHVTFFLCINLTNCLQIACQFSRFKRPKKPRNGLEWSKKSKRQNDDINCVSPYKAN